MQPILVHASMYESLSNVSAFLTSISATWSLVTEFPLICGTTIVLFRISDSRSPIMVGLLCVGWTEYGLSAMCWLLEGCGPFAGRCGGGLEWSLDGVADSDLVRLLACILFARS